MLTLSRLPPNATPFPYTTLFRSLDHRAEFLGAPFPFAGIHLQCPRQRFRGLSHIEWVIDVDRVGAELLVRAGSRDRKSTRLNSSHLVISYAVFCLKKKNRRRDVR